VYRLFSSLPNYNRNYLPSQNYVTFVVTGFPDQDMIQSVALLADIPRFQTGRVQGFFLSILISPLSLNKEINQSKRFVYMGIEGQNLYLRPTLSTGGRMSNVHKP
jgi:hypothetical protein